MWPFRHKHGGGRAPRLPGGSHQQLWEITLPGRSREKDSWRLVALGRLLLAFQSQKKDMKEADQICHVVVKNCISTTVQE